MKVKQMQFFIMIKWQKKAIIVFVVSNVDWFCSVKRQNLLTASVYLKKCLYLVKERKISKYVNDTEFFFSDDSKKKHSDRAKFGLKITLIALVLSTL